MNIYQDYFSKVSNFIQKNNGTQEDAQEVFQEAIFQLSVRLRTRPIVIHSTFEAYFFTVCKNLWRKELIIKGKRVRNRDLSTLKSEEPNQIASMLYQEQEDLFREKLNALSENCKALLQAYFSKTPYDVIVKTFNYSSENVAFQRVFKCKKRLTELIQKDRKYKDLRDEG